MFWRRRTKISSILYFVNRYVEVMSYVSVVRLVFPVQSQVISRCSTGISRHS